MSRFLFQKSSTCQELMDDVESTIRHTIVEEEGIPFETVTNFEEVFEKCFMVYCGANGCVFILHIVTGQRVI